MPRTVRFCFVLAFTSATVAVAEPIDMAELDRALGAAAVRTWEQRLRTPLSGPALKALLRARYADADDRAYIDARDLEHTSPVRLREFTREGEVYSLVMPNGRAFTVTSTDGGRTVRVNGVMLAWNELSLEKLAHAVEAALHRSFVVHRGTLTPFFAPRRAEASGIPMLLSALGFVVYYGYRWATSPSLPDRIEERYRKARAVCENERADPAVSYRNSATLVAVRDLGEKHAALLALGKSPRRCAIDVEREDLPLDAITPRFTARDLRRTCGAALDFMDCVEAFRSDPTDPAATVNFTPRGPSGSSR